MARWRPEQPEPEGSEDAQTIRALSRYAALARLQMAEPPIPGVEAGMSIKDARRVCAAHPDHPAVVRALDALDQADAEEASP